jgi:nitronate monooxygenase
MDLVADGRLAAAVSRAGGLGVIGGGYGDAAWLERELAAAGDARIGVGFITWSLETQPTLLDLALDRGACAIILSFGDPGRFAPRIRAAGAKLVCQVQNLAQARAAVDAGADILVAQGSEAGGHGLTRSTLTLVPEVVDAFPEVPVVAAGGIADGRGLAAVMMLGAEGALMGTRFYASQEAKMPDAAKQRVVGATGDDTVRSAVFDISRRLPWPEPFTGRVLRNAHAARWLGREDELRRDIDAQARHYREAREREDFDIAGVFAGEAAGLIHDLPSAAEIVGRVVREASRLLRGGR